MKFSINDINLCKCLINHKNLIIDLIILMTGGRKRPLLANTRPAMSPTKRTVMSLLARARAVQNKEPIQTAANTSAMIQPTPQHPPLPQQQSVPPPTAQLPQLQITAGQRPTIIQQHAQHPVLAPAIHSLLHAQ